MSPGSWRPADPLLCGTLVGVASLSTFRKTAVISGDPLILSRKRAPPSEAGVAATSVWGPTLRFDRLCPPDIPWVSEHCIEGAWSMGQGGPGYSPFPGK